MPHFGVMSDPDLRASMPRCEGAILDPAYAPDDRKHEYAAAWKAWAAVRPEAQWPLFLKTLLGKTPPSPSASPPSAPRSASAAPLSGPSGSEPCPPLPTDEGYWSSLVSAARDSEWGPSLNV